MLGRVKRHEIDFESEALSPALFRQLGDAHGMFSQYQEGHRTNLLFYRLDEAEEAAAPSQWLIVWRNDFIYGDRENVFERRIRQRTALDYQQVIQFIRGRGTAATVFHTIQNKLGLRLLQLKLWMAGFYYGRIDGWWGPLSHRALFDLLEQIGRAHV